jgi:hypothetical protein
MERKTNTNPRYNKKSLNNEQLTIEIDDLEQRLSELEDGAGKATKKGKKKSISGQADSKSLIEHLKKAGISKGFKSFFKEREMQSIAQYGRGAKWATIGKLFLNDSGSKVLSKFLDKQYSKEQQIQAKKIQQRKSEGFTPKEKKDDVPTGDIKKSIEELRNDITESFTNSDDGFKQLNSKVDQAQTILNSLAKFIMVNKGFTSEIDPKSGKIKYRKGGKYAKAEDATFFANLQGIGSAADEITGNKKSFSSSAASITNSVSSSGKSPIKAIQNMEKTIDQLAKTLKDLVKNVNVKDAEVIDKVKSAMKDLKIDVDTKLQDNSGALADILKLIKEQKATVEEQKKTFDALAPEEDEKQEQLYNSLYKALQDIIRDHPDLFRGGKGGGILGGIGGMLVGGGIAAAAKSMFSRSPKAATAAKGAAQGEAAAAKSATTAEANALKAAGQGEAATATRLAKGATGAVEGGATAVSGGAKVLGAAGKLMSRVATPLTIGLGAYEGYTGYQKAAELEKAGMLTHEQANIEKGKAVGGAAVGTGGALAGAAAGAAMGSIVPGVGTLIGGAVGGLAGWYLGKKGGEAAGAYTGKALTTKPTPMKSSNLKPAAPNSGATLVAMNREMAQNQQMAAIMRQAAPAAPVAQAPVIVNNNSAIAMPQGDKDIKVANDENTLNRLMASDVDFPHSNFNIG